MPADKKWTQAARRLYNKLPAEDQAVIDSYSERPTSPASHYKRAQKLKRLAILLLCEVGEESRHTILVPEPERGIES